MQQVVTMILRAVNLLPFLNGENLSPVEAEYLESIKNIQSIAKKKGDS